MRDREYTASKEVENTDGAEDHLIEKLLREAIQDFLDDITPNEKTRRLRIDDKREDMKPVAELIQTRRRCIQRLNAIKKLDPNPTP